jgi:branched-chain amino acid transport system ATP-binding protein
VSTANGTPLLEVEDLHAGYGGTAILRGVSLVVERGETVVVLGPNGHGKTTLLRTISGLVKPTAGRIELDGEGLTGRAPDSIVGRGVVQIPQGDLLFGEMTVLDNLLMGAYRAEPWRRRQDRLDSVFAIFPRLAERRRQLARTLSGGERRMLGIGRGLMNDAKILLIDEPSLGLAPVVIQDVYRQIREIKQRETTVLLVEESAGHVRELADRVYVLESGRVVMEGATDDLLGREDLVRSYLGM